jgi:hypothetical protein
VIAKIMRLQKLLRSLFWKMARKIASADSHHAWNTSKVFKFLIRGIQFLQLSAEHIRGFELFLACKSRFHGWAVFWVESSDAHHIFNLEPVRQVV